MIAQPPSPASAPAPRVAAAPDPSGGAAGAFAILLAGLLPAPQLMLGNAAVMGLDSPELGAAAAAPNSAVAATAGPMGQATAHQVGAATAALQLAPGRRAAGAGRNHADARRSTGRIVRRRDGARSRKAQRFRRRVATRAARSPAGIGRAGWRSPAARTATFQRGPERYASTRGPDARARRTAGASARKRSRGSRWTAEPGAAGERRFARADARSTYAARCHCDHGDGTRTGLVQAGRRCGPLAERARSGHCTATDRAPTVAGFRPAGHPRTC